MLVCGDMKQFVYSTNSERYYAITCIHSQTNISVRRELVNHQCNALVSEVEAKRRFFLADLDYEERVRQADIESSVSGLERLMASGKSVTRYSHDVMAKKEAGAFLQVSEKNKGNQNFQPQILKTFNLQKK